MEKNASAFLCFAQALPDRRAATPAPPHATNDFACVIRLRKVARPNPLPSFQESGSVESYVKLVIDAGGLSAKVAEKIAETYPMGIGLATANTVDLARAGVTAKQAERIAAMLSLCRFLASDTYRPALRGPDDVVKYLRHVLRNQEQESFVVIMLDARMRVIDAREIAKGSLSHVDVHPREVFRDAIRLRSHSIIVAHNHPSGDPDPSEADITLTRRIKEVGNLIGIPLLDHVIIGLNGTRALSTMGVI